MSFVRFSIVTAARRWRPGGRRGAVLLLFLLFPFFFVGGPAHGAARSYKAAWDLGHILFFALGSWVVCEGLARKRQGVCSSAGFFANFFFLVILAGITIELLQMLVLRGQPDIFDILRNQLGCLLAFVFFFSDSKKRSNSVLLLQGFSLLLLLIALIPLGRALVDEQRARDQFPLLSDFETSMETDRWQHPDQLMRDSSRARHGRFSMRVQLTTATYSGTTLFYFPGDWRKYRTLHFSVYNPDNEPLELHSMLYDRLHSRVGREFFDRYNARFYLKHGWNDLIIPLSEVAFAPEQRAMDMEHLRGFTVFVIRRQQPMIINLDHIYLD